MTQTKTRKQVEPMNKISQRHDAMVFLSKDWAVEDAELIWKRFTNKCTRGIVVYKTGKSYEMHKLMYSKGKPHINVHRRNAQLKTICEAIYDEGFKQ